ncbi:MAG: glycerophosphodiester phosphodiesterase [Treponema sp.]|nr:glycerophosphodiester phosphodiesterase [Treponema sp.]
MSRVPLFPDRRRPLIFAHRGCSSLAPENTLAAFRKARDLGVPGIELDVHICATGELVVVHDGTFTRTAGPGADAAPVEELSWRAIRSLDTGSFFDPRFHQERPLRLEEALEEFCPAMYVDIELKSRRIGRDPLPGRAAALLKALGPVYAGAVSVSSFNPFCLSAFKRAAPPIPVAAIWSADRELPLVLRRGLGRWIARCDYVKPAHYRISPLARLVIGGWEQRPLVAWTVDTVELAERLARQGCAGIITNRPQDMLGILQPPEPAPGESRA